jgi:hypothetical protein
MTALETCDHDEQLRCIDCAPEAFGELPRDPRGCAHGVPWADNCFACGRMPSPMITERYPFHLDGTICVVEDQITCPRVWHFATEETRQAHLLNAQQSPDDDTPPAELNVGDQIVDSRVSVYGEPVSQMAQIAQIWSAILGKEHVLQAHHVPLFMMGLKLVRTAQCPDYSDNSDDIEGWLGIFRQVIGDDMIEARLVSEYLEKKATRG